MGPVGLIMVTSTPKPVFKQRGGAWGKTLNSCTETAAVSDPTSTEALNFCQRKKKSLSIHFVQTIMLLKQNKTEQGGLGNYLLKANYIPEARVMPLDRHIKHKYLYTLSPIIKGDSKVKQISK